MSQRRTNEEWVESLSGTAGEKAQFDAYQDLSKYLYKVAWNLLVNMRGTDPRVSGLPGETLEGVVKDSTQEALEKLARGALQKYEGNGNFTSYAARIVVRQVQQELRRSRYSKGISRIDALPNDPDSDQPVLEVIADESINTPEKAARLSEIQQSIANCLEQLSPRWRTAFTLRMQDYLTDEIAEHLDTTASAVYQLIRNAKKSLRECLVASGIDEDTLVAL